MRRTCRLPQIHHSRVINTRLSLYLPTSELPATPAYRCHVEKLAVMTEMAWTGAKSLVSGEVRTLKPVSAEQCRQAWLNKIYDSTELVQVASNVWSTNRSLEVTYTYCCWQWRRAILSLGAVAPPKTKIRGPGPPQNRRSGAGS